MPIRRYSVSKSSSRTSTPSTRTAPPVTSNSRGTSDSSVVLPAPVPPMIAVTSPARARKLMSRRTGASAPGYWKVAPRNSTPPAPSRGCTGSAVGTDDRARHHHRHEGRHHDRHQNLHEVLQERDQRADL